MECKGKTSTDVSNCNVAPTTQLTTPVLITRHMLKTAAKYTHTHTYIYISCKSKVLRVYVVTSSKDFYKHYGL